VIPRNGRPRRALLAPAVLVLALAGGADKPPSPEDEARSIRLAPGLRLELVAAEPMVVSPVAMAFDERGRLFVAENRGYPSGPGPGKPPAGRIALLEDLDGDGRMDRRNEFAEGLTFPNGVLPWRGGLIVTCAPDILYLLDRDGDGRADERRVLFTGFLTAGSTQLRVSHPSLGLDGYIYVAGGLTGGKVTSPGAPGRPPVEFRRADFRFRPDTAEGEAVDGGAQFGLTFDEAGRRFFCYNRVQIQHAVIDSATLRRNPRLAFSDTVQDCPVDLVAEPLQGHGAAARLHPISGNVTTADSHAGTFTAACGVTIFRGLGLPEVYRGGAFSCDPTANLVHFDRLEPLGATFRARPIDDGPEFLASSNDWTRPVFLASGPDGALYVCDMVRKTIEHPDYLPDEIRKRTDFTAGKDLGRIWRVIDEKIRPEEARDIRRSTAGLMRAELVGKSLSSADGWWSDTAHRLLLAGREPAAIEALRRLADFPLGEGVPDPDPARLHAIRLLESFGALGDFALAKALQHPWAPIREYALELAGARLPGNPAWLAPILKLAGDPDARVRFRAAIALGGSRAGAEEVPAALARIAARDGSDRWARAAVFSSLAGREAGFLAALRDLPRAADGLDPALLDDLGRLVAASQPSGEWSGVIQSNWEGSPGFSEGERTAFLAGFAGEARGRVASGDSGDVLAAAIGPSPEQVPLRESVARLIDAAKATAIDPGRPIDRRRSAVGLLGCSGFDRAGQTLLGLLGPDQPPALRASAARALGSIRDGRVAPALLEPGRFAGYSPATGDEVLAAIFSRPDHLPGLLAALEGGRIPIGAVDALRRRQLAQHGDPEVRRRAGAIFGAVAGDRAKVYEEYKGVIAEASDPAVGRAVFRRECASCHRLDRERFAVGPDLFGVRNQPKAAILLHVLVPDHEITPGFASYTVALKDGRVLAGLIASETPSSLTIRQPLGKEETVLRDHVEAISAGSESLMPRGLEKNITRREFAGLLAYLKGEGTP